jgi:SAM-dependent methyltransferase
MQTRGEKHLVEFLTNYIRTKSCDSSPSRILNVGAGKNVSIENQLLKAGCNYVCDRLDPEDCNVNHPNVDKCWICTIENISMIPDGNYSAAFANYVIEHISDLRKAAKEIHRILQPSGIFVTTIPNISAPEFKLAKITPLWFHKLIRGRESWETTYLYKNISELVGIFRSEGLNALNIRYFPCIESYLQRFPLLGRLARYYDQLVSLTGIKIAMGDVCIVFRKEAVPGKLGKVTSI